MGDLDLMEVPVPVPVLVAVAAGGVWVENAAALLTNTARRIALRINLNMVEIAH